MQLLNEDFEDEVRDPLSKNPVAITWWISFEYIKKHDPQAVELLSFMSMLANQAVLELLLPAGDDPVTFEKALGTLQEFSFISVRYLDSEQSQYRLFDFHRLVRLAMRSWLKHSARLDYWTTVAVSRLSMLSNTALFISYEMRSQLLPHAIEILAADALQGASDPRNVPSVFLDRKLERDCRHNDTICPRCTADLVHWVALSLCKVDSYMGARAYAQRAMVLKTHILGEADASTLESVAISVYASITLSDYGNAKALCREVIKASRTEHGLSNYYTLCFTNLMMRLLRDDPNSEQDAAASEQLREEYEAGFSQTGASEGPDIFYLASISHYDAGRYHEAAAYGLCAVNGFIRTVGLESYLAIWATSYLASLKTRLHQYEEAERYGCMSMEASNKCYGLKDPLTLKCIFTLAKALRLQQKDIEAKALATKVLKLTAEVFGDTSPLFSIRSEWYHRNFDEVVQAPEPLYPSIGPAKRPDEDGQDGWSSRLTIGDHDSREQPRLSPVSDQSGGEC